MALRRPNPRDSRSPLVEAVTKHPGKWQVEDVTDGSGKTSNVEHKMWVPLEDNFCRCGKSHSDWIRAHELMHAKISPDAARPVEVRYADKTIKVSEANITAAEEYRVNYSVAQIEGQDLLEEGFCDPATTQAVGAYMDQGKYTEIVRLTMEGGPGYSAYVAAGLSAYLEDLGKVKPGKDPARAKLLDQKRKIATRLQEAVYEYSYAAERMMTGTSKAKELPSWTQVEQLAAFLEVNLRSFNDQMVDLFADEEAEDSDLKRLEAYELPPTLKPKFDAPERKTEGPMELPEAGDDGSRKRTVNWGKPDRITEAKMPLKLAPWKLQKQNRAVDEGTIPRYMHRWPSDKRVFHRSRRIPGGSVLVDDSGSMGLSTRDLDAIIEMAPASTVAVYAGHDGHTGGEIRVVAKNGKRAKAADLSVPYGGNGIDGPALEWLGTQPYPRIWISDGGVTSMDGFTVAGQRAAKDLCIKHKITMVGSAEEAAELLKTGRYAR